MNRRVTSLFSLAFVALLLAVWLAYAARPARAEVWAQKVDPWVLDTAASQAETEFLVFLAEQADLSGAAALLSKAEKGAYVYAQLTAVAARTQPTVIAELDALGAEYRPYWVANVIWVRGDMTAVQAMARRADVTHLYANPTVPMEQLPPTDEAALLAAVQAVEWNIALVSAPAVWAAGYTGQGVVIGGQDTGYQWNHPALINQYRGWNGVTADHNYNWHDAIHSGGGGVCGVNSPEPCDDHNHGTHTMGTMVGDDGGANQIGMAPGAKWIGCRNMNQGDGTPATYTECYQWFIAPTDLAGQNPDPAQAPHVINNSWGCPPSEGCTDPNVLLTIVNNVRAAGIVTVHSAGNSGPGCSTVNTPAAIYDASYSVGATNSSDGIAGFSSRGPVTIDGSNRAKPDISAPGVGVRSSIRNGLYSSSSGTSMAGPHVAGLVGLLISASPPLAGQVDEIEALINQTAVPLTTSQGCGGDGPTDVPNHVYGWGRIDALSALAEVPISLSIHKTAPTLIAPGQTVTYTIEVMNNHTISATANVVLTDTIPTGATFITATLPHTFDGTIVAWNAASLAAGGSWSVALVVHAPGSATVVNDSYGVRSDEVETVTGPPVTTMVVPYELLLAKTAASPTTLPGAVLTYTLAVTNAHPVAAVYNLVLTDTLPAQTTFFTATTPYTVTGDTIQWQAPSLAAGANWYVNLAVQVGVTATGSITNSAYGVSSDELPDPATGPPVVTPILTYDLRLDKTVSTAVAGHGDVLTYTLTVSNAHAVTTLNNLVLTDTIPTGTTFVTATLPHLLDGDTVQWEVASLAPGEAWVVELVVQVNPVVGGTIIANSDYAVRSDEVSAVFGPPVTTIVSSLPPLYLPFIIKE